MRPKQGRYLIGGIYQQKICKKKLCIFDENREIFAKA
jgi:hypothetical protein